MNCKPGDLAIVIKASRESNIGKIVRVLRLYSREEKGVAWEVECETVVEVVGIFNQRPARRNPEKALIAWDDWLRPISGVPVNDEVTDDIKETA
jgi:hypothetical protein